MGKSKQRALNATIIATNLAEANQEVANLLFKAVHGGLKEGELEIGLLHAYHHLNFAWNIRRTSTANYMNLTEEQFKLWGKYPIEIEADE